MTSFMERKRAELRDRGIDPARLPPGQYMTDRFPVLHVGEVPDVDDPTTWTLDISGDAVGSPRSYSWAELMAMPVTEVTTDIHCVTKWSKFDMVWRGIALDDLLAGCDIDPGAATLLAWDVQGYSANLPYRELLGEVCLAAFEVDGAPLEPDHGYPLRLVVPYLYFWKSTKWLTRLEITRDAERVGFWEENGYHVHGDPFREQRMWGDGD